MPVLQTESGTVQVALDDYLFCVLAGEMEPTAPLESLKAQAVAARTFVYRRILQNRERPGSLHPGDQDGGQGADLCTDFTHCMAYRARDTAISG